VTRFKEQEGFTGGTPVSVETVMGPL